MARPRNFRFAWLVAGAVFVVASLGWGTLQAASLLAFDRERFQETFAADVAEAVTTLDVDNGTGSVRIVGTDADEISIDGKIVRGLSKPSHTERVVGETLQIDARCSSLSSFCSVDYVVQVPRDVDLKVRASGGGVRVIGVDGSLDLSSSGGDVRVERATGALRLRSSGGGVTATELESSIVDVSSSGGSVRLEFTDDPSKVNATSSGGGVTVVVPDSAASYLVDASSSGGGEDVSVNTNNNSERSIIVHSSGGGVTVRYPPTQ